MSGLKGPVVVAGATGFVGRNLVPALLQAGHGVRGGSRSPSRAQLEHPEIPWVHLDVADPTSLEKALEGADSLVYLVHQMANHGEDLLADERASATQVLRAAEKAGVRRIVYLGGPKPQGSVSVHLAARLATGEVLRSGTVSTIELQAGMVVGAGSESWLIVRDLALRLPVMVLPNWLRRRSQPIGIDDIVTAITRCLTLEGKASLCLPLPGPETLSARDLLLRIGAAQGTRPLMIPVPVLTPALSSHWIRLVTRADFTIARQLVDGLTCDLVAQGDSFWDHCPDLHPTPLDAAIASAISAEPISGLPTWQRRWEKVVRRLSLPAR